MTIEEFGAIMANAEAAWMINVPSETREMYWRSLQDLDGPVVRLAMSKLISTDQFFPKIARIREAARSVIVRRISASDAIGLINQAIRKFGYYGSLEAIEWLKSQNSTLGRVVGAIGFETICHADENLIRREIERLYKELDQETEEWERLPGNVQKAITSSRQALTANGIRIEMQEQEG